MGICNEQKKVKKFYMISYSVKTDLNGEFMLKRSYLCWIASKIEIFDKNHKKAQTTSVQTQINVHIFIPLVMMKMILNEMQLRQFDFITLAVVLSHYAMKG